MIDVIQVFKSKEIFTKSSYTSENRKIFYNSNNCIDSINGYLKGNTLMLPASIKETINIAKSGLIILQDIQHKDSSTNNEDVLVFNSLKSSKSFELFNIRKSLAGYYELEINYSSNSIRIGLPRRENHKFCNLEKGKPIRYMVNGKSDFTMTGRKERTFYEFDYIIEWLGTANKIEFCPLSQVKVIKSAPIKKSKLIDERKILK